MSKYSCVFALTFAQNTNPKGNLFPMAGISYAKATLPYPIFAAEFDPFDRGYLVVGGGGGESKSGVPNQIVCGLGRIFG